MTDLIIIPSTAIIPAAPAPNPLFNADLLAGRLGASSIVVYRRDVADYLRYCTSMAHDPAVPTSLAAWRDYLVNDRQLAASTIGRMMAAVKRLIKEAAAQDKMAAETAAKFAATDGVSARALKGRMKAHNKTKITPADMRKLCAAPDPETLLGKRDRALLLTLATSGVRISEACNLKMEDIEVTEAGCLLTVRGKTDTEPRQALLGGQAYAAIELWLNARGWREGYIFTSTQGKGRHLVRTPLTTAGAWLLVQKYAEAAGLKFIKCHDFRRFVITQVIARDGIEVARQVAGHKNIQTTTRYNLNSVPVGRTNDLF